MIKKEPNWKSYIVQTTTPIFTPEQCNIISRIGRSMPPQNAEVGGGKEGVVDTKTRGVRKSLVVWFGGEPFK